MKHLRTILLAMAFGVATTLADAQPSNGHPSFEMKTKAIQPDGKVVAAGSVALFGNTYTGYAFAIERRNADGTLDTTFNGGFVSVPVWGYSESALAIALQPDGSIFVGGNAMDPIARINYSNCDTDLCATYPAVVKLRPDGTVDDSFGRVILNLGANNFGTYSDRYDVPDDAYLSSIAVQPDGKIVARTRDGRDIAHINPDGTLDTTFVGSHRIEAIRLAELNEATKFQGLWWGGPSQSGWNLTIAHQGEVLFATWATYDAQGQSLWLSMTATQIAPASYAGTLYKTTGPLGQVTLQQVGFGTLVFSSRDEARFDYEVRGSVCAASGAVGPAQPICDGQIPISKFGIAGPQPTCVSNTGGSLTAATNFTDLWFADPAGSDPGWAVGIAHIGDMLFVTWLTYDVDGSPMWLFGTGGLFRSQAYGYDDYDGQFVRTRGAPFSSYDPNLLTYTDAGVFTIEVGDGNHLSVTSSALGSQQRNLTRYVFRGEGTVCN